MQALQGATTPVRVTHFLIVNPPSWFGKVWKIMKTMLSAEFQKKVQMIPECSLSNFLAPGYENFLPDEMATGEAPTEELVRDWVTYRKFIEGPEQGDDDESDSLPVDASSTLDTPRRKLRLWRTVSERFGSPKTRPPESDLEGLHEGANCEAIGE